MRHFADYRASKGAYHTFSGMSFPLHLPYPAALSCAPHHARSSQLTRRPNTDSDISDRYRQILAPILPPEIRTVPVTKLRSFDYIMIGGRSFQVTHVPTIDARRPPRTTVHLLFKDSITQAIKGGVYPSDFMTAASHVPVPQEAVRQVSVGTLCKNDYALIEDRACLIRNVARSDALPDVTAQVWVSGIDIVDGKFGTGIYEAKRLVTMCNLPLGPLMPRQLLKMAPTEVTAAALSEGYHVVIQGHACTITYSQRLESTMKVVGRVLYTRKELEIEPGMTILVRIGRHGIDAGAQCWL